MSPQEKSDYDRFFDMIIYIEQNYPVETWKIGRIHIWPLIRICQEQVDSLEKQNGGRIKFGRCLKVKKICNTILNAWKAYYMDKDHNDVCCSRRDVMALTSTVYRKAMLAGEYCLAGLSSFYDKFGVDSFINYEISVNGKYKYPRAEKSVLLERIISKKKIIGKIKNSFPKMLSNNVAVDIFLPQKEVVYEFAKQNGFELISINRICLQMTEINLYKDFFMSAIKKNKPKFIIVECYYSSERFGLILAAKELGIPCADLQHGIQGSHHIAYYYGKMPTEGYELLPDYFFVWSKFDKQNIESWTGKEGRHRAMIVGNTWMEFCERRKDILELRNVSRVIERIANGKVNVLFTMDYDLPNDNIFKLIKKSPKNWYWWIRMHPVTSNDNNLKERLVSKMSGDNWNIDDATLVPLPVLLRVIDINITFGSTVARECNDLGIPSIVESDMVFEGYKKGELLMQSIPMDKVKISDIIATLKWKKYFSNISSEWEDYELVKKIMFGDR